jgi:hypothetical protein
METGRGGYKQPMNPAPVSGPGALSQRTDGGAVEGMTQPAQSYTGGSYGNNKQMSDQQNAAPLAGNPIQTIGLDVPTQFPDEPMSYGANYGEGPGLDTSHLQGMAAPSPASVLYKLMQFDKTGKYEALYNKINME